MMKGRHHLHRRQRQQQSLLKSPFSLMTRKRKVGLSSARLSVMIAMHCRLEVEGLGEEMRAVVDWWVVEGFEVVAVLLLSTLIVGYCDCSVGLVVVVVVVVAAAVVDVVVSVAPATVDVVATAAEFDTAAVVVASPVASASDYSGDAMASPLSANTISLSVAVT